MDRSQAKSFGYALNSAVSERPLDLPMAVDLAIVIISSEHSFPVSMHLHFDCCHHLLHCLPVLDEADIGALLTETLTADVQTVFSDQTSSVCADSAVKDLVSFRSRLHALPARPDIWYPACEFEEGILTIRESPFRRCAGASTRRTRETCWVVAICDLRICRTIQKRR